MTGNLLRKSSTPSLKQIRSVVERISRLISSTSVPNPIRTFSISLTFAAAISTGRAPEPPHAPQPITKQSQPKPGCVLGCLAGWSSSTAAVVSLDKRQENRNGQKPGAPFLGPFRWFAPEINSRYTLGQSSSCFCFAPSHRLVTLEAIYWLEMYPLASFFSTDNSKGVWLAGKKDGAA